MKKDGKDVESGKWMKDKNGKLGFIEEDRCKIWKEHMEKIMNEENDWYHVVEGPVERVTRKEVVEALKKINQGKAAGLSEISTEMIMASGKIGDDMMMQRCQQVFDGNVIPDEWKTSVVVPIFNEKGDVMNCGSYRGVKLLEQGMNIVERRSLVSCLKKERWITCS